MLLNVLQAVFALAVTLGLIGAAAFAARRWAPAGMLNLRPQAARRLEVLETLILDAQHRLVIVRVDTSERVILLGEGRLLEGPSAADRSSAPSKSQRS